MDFFQRLHLLQICVCRFKSLIVSVAAKNGIYLFVLLRIVMYSIYHMQLPDNYFHYSYHVHVFPKPCSRALEKSFFLNDLFYFGQLDIS